MNMRLMAAAFFVSVLGFASFAQNVAITSIEEYNRQLPVWGVSWAPGSKSVNGYYQSFYTGFAMRSQFPERIHVRTSRGNQTRVSVILDDRTVSDYLFDLAKRRAFFSKVAGKGAVLDTQPSGGKSVPQLAYFNQILDSGVYGIQSFVDRAEQGAESAESIYRKSLEVLGALNRGRVFHLQFDLHSEFAKWKSDMRRLSGGDARKITQQPALVITAINSLLWGRVNFTEKPSTQILAQLENTLRLALGGAPEQEFNAQALALFKMVTGTKYAFRVLDRNGQWRPALACDANVCTLAYSEFTAIYPTGSLEAKTSDEQGNRINDFATPGLWQFLSRQPRHDVDNIRDEPYYGFAPKMDYEAAGNGFHNPAVRFWNPAAEIRKSFGLPAGHTILWAVKRGGVSSGCLRLALGHVWEMRQIFPVENERMIRIPFFGDKPQDFDVYDIDGDGQLEVMGVEYMVSYGLQGSGGLARREGSGMEVNADKKREFYSELYGSRGVFTVDGNGRFLFVNPKVSMPSHLDFKRKTVTARLTLNGTFPLYEQVYEQDKVQFYALSGPMDAGNKRYARIVGRVRGCAPDSDKKACGEAAFDREAAELF